MASTAWARRSRPSSAPLLLVAFVAARFAAYAALAVQILLRERREG